MYQHGKKTRQPKNTRVILAAAATVSIVVLVSAFIVHNDIANTTAPKTNIPIVTEVGTGAEGEKLSVNEELFYLELPEDWKLLDRINKPGSVNAYIWNSSKKGGNDRRLILHIDIMPGDYKVVKMQPLTPKVDGFIVGELSDDCSNFATATGTQAQSTAPIMAKWQNISFMCDPIKANQTIGTGTPGGSIGTTLNGGRGDHKFFFYYEDHNINPDSVLLRDILGSFKAK